MAKLKVGAGKKRGPAKGTRPSGRQKGTPNKITKALKDMILGALDKAGGEDYLVAQASANPNAFLTLVGKVLPMQVAGDPDNPITTIHEIRFRAVAPAHDASS